jgi:hypothetical protein
MRISSAKTLRTGSRFLLLAAVLFLVGAHAAGARAQVDDVKIYTSEQYDFSLKWNTEVWRSYSTSSSGDQESIWISTDTVTVQIDLAPAKKQTAQSCVDDAVTGVQQTKGILQPVETKDLAAPDTLKGSKSIILKYPKFLDGRTTTVNFGRYIACVPVSPNGMALIQVEIRAGIWGEELEVVNDLFKELDLTAA